MTTNNNTVETDTVDTSLDPTSELQSLKDIATRMGITFSNNISINTLKSKIEEARDSDSNPASLREKISKEKTALVRVRITCQNVNKRHLQGEIFTVGNKYIGTVRKYVPFNTVWHVPKVILEFIRSKKFASRTEVETDNHVTHTQTVLVPEYIIEELPALTKEQMDELASNQRARNSIEN